MHLRGVDLIALVGGMTWHSAARYYHLLNERGEVLWDPRSTPESLVATIDFAPLFRKTLNDEWRAIADRLAGVVATLAGGAHVGDGAPGVRIRRGQFGETRLPPAMVAS